MRLLQSGVPRSGNYWLYTILQKLLLAGGVEIKRWVTSQALPPLNFQENFAGQKQVDALSLDPLNERYFWRISSVYKQLIRDLPEYLAQVTHLWTHAAYTEALRPVALERTHRFYIVRDVRDVLVSLSYFRGRKYNLSPEIYLEAELERQTRHWVEHVRSFATTQEDFCRIRYEDLKTNLDGSVQKIHDYLGLSLSTQALTKIAQEVTFDALAIHSPRHLHRGVSGVGTFTLSPEQLAVVNRIAGPTLALYDYA